jgi:hypothetical protein
MAEKNKDNPYVSSATCAAITEGLNKSIANERMLTDEKIKSIKTAIYSVGATITIIVSIVVIVVRFI